MRRGDESQRVRRSVCGQNKMYPILKECLNCQSGLERWLGQFHFTTPLGYASSLFHTSMSAHTASSFQLVSEPQEGKSRNITSYKLKHTADAKTSYPEIVFIYKKIHTSNKST